MTTTRESLNAASFLLTPEKRAELEKKINDADEIILTEDQKKSVDIIKKSEQSSLNTENESKEEISEEDSFFEIETPLKGKKVYGKKNEKNPDDNLEISEEDSFYKYLMFDLGEKDKDPKILAKEIKEAKEKASKYDEVETKANTYEEFFLNMPDDLKAINTAYISNQDYRSLINELSIKDIDYTKDVSMYTEEQLVNMYKSKMPSKIKQHEWDELDELVQESAIYLAKEYYLKEKQDYERKAEKIKNDNDLYLQRHNQSIEASLLEYQKENELDANKKAKLKKILQEDLISVFYNKDGTYKSDAVEKLAYALYGKETISLYEEKLQEAIERQKRKSISQAREEVIKTSADTTKGNNQQLTAEQKVAAEKHSEMTRFIRTANNRTF